MATELKKHELADLEKLYTEAETADADIFSEMRSNLLLVAGEHYNRRQSSFFRRLRDSKDITEQQKIRLTKNHIQRISKIYANNIISMAPGVGFEPKNESELQDQKAAELHHAVWQDAMDRYKLDEKVDDWCDSFINVGETNLKLFFDPNAGELKGHMQAIGEDGQLAVDEMGQPQLGEPVYTGEFMFEEVYGFNLLRPSECKELSQAEWLCVRKMVSKEKLIEKFPDKKNLIHESADSTMVVFDGARSGYRKTSNEVLLKEYYFKPCQLYPSGYYYFATREGILTEGDLPGAVFPIISQAWDKIPTTPRGRSPIKTMRPFQAEINRAASKIAEHQITLGDDKLLIQNGTKVSAGASLPGVRSINYTGAQPEVLQGRDGSQYLAYMQAQVGELYQVMGVAEDGEENQSGQLDPYTLLFRSASQKKKFQRYAKRFERFLVEVARTYIKLAKLHMSEDQVIFAVGRKEQINIAEFKNTSDLGYQIKLVPQSDDIETKMGKQLTLTHALQYVGGKLEKEDIGKIMRSMPYANFDESFDDMTIDYDAATNIILALDRGEVLLPDVYDNNPYMIKRLVSRMRQADFKFLDPQVQQHYKDMVTVYQENETQRLQQIQLAESGFIPTGGYMVTCDLYVADPADPAKTRRARLPYEAVQWLIKKLETQGASLDQLEQMNQGAVTQMAQMMNQKRLGGAPEGMGVTPPNQQG